MIVRRLIAFVAALAAIAAAAVVCVVAAALAIYALARNWLTPAVAAAVTALVFALLAAAIAALALRRAPVKEAESEAGLVERLMRTAGEHPVLAAVAAALAAAVVIRNPALLSTLIGAITAALAPKRES